MSSFRLAPALAAAGILATLAASLPAQAPVDLGKRNARSKYTLGRVFAAQELADGRVVASDTKEQVFRLVDFNKGEVGILGKQGDDSTSYRTASTIVRLAGDSLGLYDPAGRKMLHITPTGTVADFVPMPKNASGRPFGTLIGADANGSLYFTVPERLDTVSKGFVGYTSVTRIGIGADAEDPQLTFRTRGADQLKLSGREAFYFKDAVAVRNDGLLARVAADTYQVIWTRNGREIGRTGPLPNPVIAISEAEQKAIKDSTTEAMKAMMAGAGRGGPGGAGAPGGATSSGGGGGERMIVMSSGGMSGGAPVMISGGGASFAAGFAAGAAGAGGDTKTVTSTNGPINFADIPWAPFPANKPPMPQSGVIATFDRSGNLWVARERVHGDAVPHYDVIAEGKGVVARINLPAGTRLVGFGKNSVYLTREEDGSEWLERYAMPKVQ